MSDHILDGMQPEQIQLFRAASDRRNLVRVYNDMGDDRFVVMQIAGWNDGAAAFLTRDQASKLIECLHSCLTTCAP